MNKYPHDYYTKPVIDLIIKTTPSLTSFFKVNDFKKNKKKNTIDVKLIKCVSTAKNTKVSLIIPTRNRYTYLKGTLQKVLKQTVLPAEIIIIDQSDEFNPNFYTQFKNDNIKLIHQKTIKGQWSARNEGVIQSKYEYLAFLDDEAIIKNDWLENHLKTIEFFNCSISTSRINNFNDTTPHPAFGLDTSSCLIKKDVFNTIGPFDVNFDELRWGDGEFGKRATQKGFFLVHNPLSNYDEPTNKTGGLTNSLDAFQMTPILAPFPNQGVTYFYKKHGLLIKLPYFLIKVIIHKLIQFNKNSLTIIGYIILFPLLAFKFVLSFLPKPKKSI